MAAINHTGEFTHHSGGLTYCTGELSSALLEQTHDLGFLGGGTAAADHSWALAGQLHELIFIVFEANLGVLQRKGRVSQGQLPAHSRKRLWLLGGPGQMARSHAHLQGVSRDDQGTVMLPAEGVQLEMGPPTIGYLEGERDVENVLLSGGAS